MNDINQICIMLIITFHNLLSFEGVSYVFSLCIESLLIQLNGFQFSGCESLKKLEGKVESILH